MALTRGRVVSAERAADATTVVGPARWQGLRRAALLEAREHARSLLEEARARAHEAQREAHDEVERLRASAARDGMADAEAAAAARWVELKRAEERWLREREGDLLGVARLLAERLLLRSLELDPRTITDLARQALAPLRRARQLNFHVHPDDAEALRAGLGASGHDADLIEVHLEPTASRGAVRIVTELGSVRAELAPQLDRLLAALRAP